MCMLRVNPLYPLLSLFPHVCRELQELLSPCSGHTFRLKPPPPDIDVRAKNALSWYPLSGAEIITDPKTRWNTPHWISIGSTLPHNQDHNRGKITGLSAHTVCRLEKILVSIPWHNLTLSVSNHSLKECISGGFETPGSFASCLFNAIAYMAVQEMSIMQGLKILLHEFWLYGNYPIAINISEEKLVLVCAKP